jgi:hypothetical protein
LCLHSFILWLLFTPQSASYLWLDCWYRWVLFNKATTVKTVTFKSSLHFRYCCPDFSNRRDLDKNNFVQKCVCFVCRQRVILQYIVLLKNVKIPNFEIIMREILSRIIHVQIAGNCGIGYVSLEVIISNGLILEKSL